MVTNPFSSSSKEADEKPAALSAFLAPASRFYRKSTSSPQYKQLSPDEISQKIASLLAPGPPFYSTASSADLIDNISSASIMRCDALRAQAAAKVATSSADAGEWQGVGTVWSSLDSLPSGSNRFHAIPGSTATISKADDNDDGLWDSIMISCEVDGKNVQLNKSVVIPTQVLNDNHFYNGNKRGLFTTIGAGKHYKYDTFEDHASALSYANLLSFYSAPTLEMWSWPSWVPFLGKPDGGDQPAPSKPAEPSGKGSKRVWVPSTTAVSVKACWWGFTIYLPTAVFPHLDSEVQQAEKIANLINTVLTTMLNHIGNLPIPLPLQAAVQILKAIAPSTSYIATFIGWSWDEIKSFDEGHGVELSATWLLPIA